jgi:hypothetical protein
MLPFLPQSAREIGERSSSRDVPAHSPESAFSLPSLPSPADATAAARRYKCRATVIAALLQAAGTPSLRGKQERKQQPATPPGRGTR